MDVLMLSRLQFAAATMFHFLFVPLTLGISVLIACMETAYVRTGNTIYKQMAKFWGKLFLINFTLGVVTGITLEFQFGTNWSRYSAYVGDIFGSLLAIEATAAFFLESTFIGVWHFGWEKLSAKAHMVTAWLVAGAGNLSAVWILIANGFMQNPLGFEIRNGRAELTDFMAVISNPWAWNQFVHVVSASFCVAAFFMAGISAWHLLRKQHVEFFTKSMNMALVTGIIASAVVAGQGHFHGNLVAKLQPAKLAAMGIRDARGLKHLDRNLARRKFTVAGLHTVLELQGVACIDLEAAPPAKKSICSSRSFGKPVTTLAAIKEAVAAYAARAGEKLRAQRSVAGVVMVFLRTNYFKPDEPRYENITHVALPVATSDTAVLIDAAHAGLDRIFRSGYRYQKAGVLLAGLEPEACRQLSLLAPPPADEVRRRALMKTMDAVNAKWGRGACAPAAAGAGPTRSWSMRQNLLSRRYTTCWAELPEARACEPARPV